MLDENTYYLNQYENKQDILEEEWNMTLSEKKEKVIEFAIKIIEGSVDCTVFDLAFEKTFFFSDESYEVFGEQRSKLLIGEDGDEATQRAIIEQALETSCFCLYDTDLDDVFTNINWPINLVNKHFKVN